jgi:flagellar biosynthesis protein
MAKSNRKQAVALRYVAGKDTAPKMVAKGQGRMAEQILALARKNYVPIRHDPHLVEVLGSLKVDQEIPPQLYRAIAAILAFLHRINNRG